MNKPIVVNLFSGPGSGKSTTAAGVFSLLKLHGVNSELITEFAKDLTWEGRHSTLANQYYVCAKQYQKMWRVKDQVDVMVTDSPILFGMIYGKNIGAFNKMLIHLFDQFDNMNYFLTRVKKFNPAGRNQTEEEAKELDKEIRKMLDDFKIPYENLIANEDAINHIVHDVLHILNIKARFIILGNN